MGNEKNTPEPVTDQFDYTEWRRWYFDTKSPEEIDREMVEYAKTHPFHGDKAVIL